MNQLIGVLRFSTIALILSVTEQSQLGPPRPDRRVNGRVQFAVVRPLLRNQLCH